MTSLDPAELPIFVGNWCEFKIEDLFEKCNLHKVKTFDRRYDLLDHKTDEFSLPVVNAKHGNNGIMFYGRKKDFDFVDHSLCVVQNGAIATGDVYPEVQSTGVYQDAYLIKSKDRDLSEFHLQFLAVVIQRITKTRFSYDDKCTWPKLKKLFIQLPVDLVGNPDWQYMDDYVKFMKLIVVKSLSKVERVGDCFE